MKKQLLLFVTTLMPIVVSAQPNDNRVVKNGIYYNLEPTTKQAEVTHGDWDIWSEPPGDGRYSGSVSIPQHIEHEGSYYDVTSVGNFAFALCSGLTSAEQGIFARWAGRKFFVVWL